MKRIAAFLAVLVALAATSVALASPTLSGTFKTTIKHDSALGGALNGTWKLTLKDGHYKAALNGTSQATGKYRISGSKIFFGPDHSGCSATGKYKFKLKGKTLTFKKLSDGGGACAGREGVLSHKFKKVS